MAQNHLTQVQVPRLEELQSVSEHYNSDPYSLSKSVKKRFRADKKVEKAKKSADDQIKGRYALPESLTLLADDDDAAKEAKEQWEKGRREVQLRDAKRKTAPVQTSLVATVPRRPHPYQSSSKQSAASSTALNSLRARILQNTAKRT